MTPPRNNGVPIPTGFDGCLHGTDVQLIWPKNLQGRVDLIRWVTNSGVTLVKIGEATHNWLTFYLTKFSHSIKVDTRLERETNMKLLNLQVLLLLVLAPGRP